MMVCPTRRKVSSTATQDFPLKQQHKMHTEEKKKKGIGMLWNPELADVKMA